MIVHGECILEYRFVTAYYQPSISPAQVKNPNTGLWNMALKPLIRLWFRSHARNSYPRTKDRCWKGYKMNNVTRDSCDNRALVVTPACTTYMLYTYITEQQQLTINNGGRRWSTRRKKNYNGIQYNTNRAIRRNRWRAEKTNLVHSRDVRKPLMVIILSILKCMLE